MPEKDIMTELNFFFFFLVISKKFDQWPKNHRKNLGSRCCCVRSCFAFSNTAATYPCCFLLQQTGGGISPQLVLQETQLAEKARMLLQQMQPAQQQLLAAHQQMAALKQQATLQPALLQAVKVRVSNWLWFQSCFVFFGTNLVAFNCNVFFVEL